MTRERGSRRSHWRGTTRLPRRAKVACSSTLAGLEARASGSRHSAATASKALCVPCPPIFLQSRPARRWLTSEVGQVGEEYDIIGFDPRGIGQTEWVLMHMPSSGDTCRTVLTYRMN